METNVIAQISLFPSFIPKPEFALSRSLDFLTIQVAIFSLSGELPSAPSYRTILLGTCSCTGLSFLPMNSQQWMSLYYIKEGCRTLRAQSSSLEM